MNTKKEMIRILKEETEIAESLGELLKSKQRAFVKWNSGELAGVVKDEEGLLHQLSILEKERAIIFRALRPGSPENQGETMREYLEHYPSPELQELYERLKNASSAVLKRNGQNKRLLQSSLSFVHHTVRTLTDNYQRRLLDQKV